VQHLKVRSIMVMGHSHCGGVRAFVEHRGRTDPGDFIDNWMSLITPAAQALDGEKLPPADYLTRLEQASIGVTLCNLLSFPWIRSRVDGGDLQLIGAYFDVGTGALQIQSDATGFAPLAAATA
jgi:carbonic anhydrase